ncbi:MAG: hypothetical protein HONDAALG_02935 [Gammaproteobacteria bacterium]|jgi:hypothetical protein|nr:hypothetical protein [Gammaproteobacteria bacterium]
MMEHLSYSSISMFLACSESFRRKYIAGEPTFSSPALAFGSAIHGTVQAHLQTGADLLGAWNEQWHEHADDATIDWNGELPEQHFNEGVRMLSDKTILAGIKSICAQYEGGAIERKVELRVPGVPVPVIGYIDVMLKGGIPSDIKTSSKSWTEDRAQNEQQALYYLAALNQAGESVPDGRFKHFIFVKTKKPQFQALEHTHEPREFFLLFQTIQSVWRAIESGSFVKNVGTWKCDPRYCNFFTNCMGK